ncbi:hypothetical protein, partial [Pseudonocardia sp. KRD291]|uniref:hypothetical protein n=1 Tax=Pseudonocardia sp. KRD291 TaxID=2792007 RepID=UPI0035B18065
MSPTSASTGDRSDHGGRAGSSGSHPSEQQSPRAGTQGISDPHAATQAAPETGGAAGGRPAR